MPVEAGERRRAVEGFLRWRLVRTQDMAGEAPTLQLAEVGEMLQIGDIVERLVGVDLGDLAADEQMGFAGAGLERHRGVVERAGVGP